MKYQQISEILFENYESKFRFLKTSQNFLQYFTKRFITCNN